MGTRMMTDTLLLEGLKVNRKRIYRLMALMGITRCVPALRRGWISGKDCAMVLGGGLSQAWTQHQKPAPTRSQTTP